MLDTAKEQNSQPTENDYYITGDGRKITTSSGSQIEVYPGKNINDTVGFIVRFTSSEGKKLGFALSLEAGLALPQLLAEVFVGNSFKQKS